MTVTLFRSIWITQCRLHLEHLCNPVTIIFPHIRRVPHLGQLEIFMSLGKSFCMSLNISRPPCHWYGLIGVCGICSLLYHNKAAGQKFYALSQWEKHLLSSYFRPGCSLADSITYSCIRIASEKPQNCIIFASILHQEKYHAKSFSSVS